MEADAIGVDDRYRSRHRHVYPLRTPHFDRSSYHHSWSISRLQAQRTAGICDFRVTMKFCEGIHIQGESRDCLPSKDLKVQNVRSEARMIRNGQREWFSG